MRTGLPGRGDDAQQRGTQRNDLQPLRRHAVLLEQLPVQSAAIQFLRLQPAARGKIRSLALRPNPDVTIRERGVMEKCTYCVQRINAARINAEKEDRSIRDGEVVTACQAACPTEAIIFGDLNDSEQRGGAQQRYTSLNYPVLGELNTRPRTTSRP